MGLIEIVLVSIGLAMDAFAVSICKGLSMKKMDWRKAIVIGLYFGFFQMMMPYIGFGMGVGFDTLFENVDHWIAFALLVIIGGNMIRESFSEEESQNDKIDFKSMIVLAIATSIDALAVGVSYAFLDVKNIVFAFSIIGVITFMLSVIGVKIGNKFGNKYDSKAELIGGIILICIGLKILLEHLGIFKF